MSTALIVVALVVALVSIPTVAGLTAWGLAGGDGEPKNAVIGVLGALVAFGAIYNALVSYRAFWGIPDWSWWLMWVPPVAGLVGLLLARDDLSPEESSSPTDWAVGLSMQAALGVPAVLLWASGVAPTA
ncbi:MAG TPA: hypothetical protein VLB29_05870 [Nocardioidaceae bacterium]|nr:hypothetical protein [Nocardioidaceae bacterium]